MRRALLLFALLRDRAARGGRPGAGTGPADHRRRSTSGVPRGARTHRSRRRDAVPGAVRSARVAVHPRRAWAALGQPVVVRRRSESAVGPLGRRSAGRRGRDGRNPGAVRPLDCALLGRGRGCWLRCASGARPHVAGRRRPGRGAAMARRAGERDSSVRRATPRPASRSKPNSC